MSKRVYIAGPYSGPDVLTVFANTGNARNASALVFAAGYAPFVPHHDADFYERLTSVERERFDVEYFKAHSMEWLEVADCVAMLPGWERSTGTCQEIDRAQDLGIPIVELNQWDIDHRGAGNIAAAITRSIEANATVDLP